MARSKNKQNRVRHKRIVQAKHRAERRNIFIGHVGMPVTSRVFQPDGLTFDTPVRKHENMV